MASQTNEAFCINMQTGKNSLDLAHRGGSRGWPDAGKGCRWRAAKR